MTLLELALTLLATILLVAGLFAASRGGPGLWVPVSAAAVLLICALSLMGIRTRETVAAIETRAVAAAYPVTAPRVIPARS